MTGPSPRVRKPGQPFHVVRRSRKRRRCGWACSSPILPGELYVRSSIAPGMEPNDTGHWWYQDLHGHYLYDCPTYRPGDADACTLANA